MQASVTDRPRTMSAPSSWRPASRKLSIIRPVTPRSPPAIRSASSPTTTAWRSWSLPLLPWLASMTSRSGSPAVRSWASAPATSSAL
jgi:hypothetical protein